MNNFIKNFVNESQQLSKTVTHGLWSADIPNTGITIEATIMDGQLNISLYNNDDMLGLPVTIDPDTEAPDTYVALLTAYMNLKD